MKHIVTITFNPAIDKSITVEQLVPEHKMNTSEPVYHAGGGGVNIVRALHNLGFPATAIYFEGGRTGAFYSDILAAEQVNSIPISISGATRENFIVNDQSTGKQFRFGLPGPKIGDKEIDALFTALIAINQMDYLVISGSLQASIPMDIFERLKTIGDSKNAKLVVDTSGQALETALSAGVFLIKPSLRELASLGGRKDLNVRQAVEVSQDLIHSRRCEVAVISMGGRGAVLVTDKLTLMVKAPSGNVVSTVGAGDSMLAGILWSLAQADDYFAALQYGVACGSAATRRAGTELCDRGTAEELLHMIKGQDAGTIEDFKD